MSGRASQPGGLHLVAALVDEYGKLAERAGNGDLAALVVQLRAVLDLAAGPEIRTAIADFSEPAERCTKVSPGTRLTCLQSLAAGWITASESDLCPRCIRRFMVALESAVGEDEPLTWHRNYLERVKPRPKVSVDEDIDKHVPS